jgi:hypothetical protein
MLAPGGTPSVNLARAHGAKVLVVEPHPVVAKLMKTYTAMQGNIETRAGVDPRAQLMAVVAGAAAPDLIVFPDRGYFGGAVGLQALGENFLFTVESLAAAFSRLSPSGLLSVNVWLDEPLRHAPRMLDLMASALRRQGIREPGDYMVVMRGWGSVAIVAGTAPLAAEQLDSARAFADKGGFDILWPVSTSSVEPYHGETGGDLETIVAVLLGPHPETFHRSYFFDVTAPLDDRPFFNQFLHPGAAIRHLFRSDAAIAALSVSERGLVMVLVILGFLLLASTLLLLAPLAFFSSTAGGRALNLFFFAGIGAGFMFAEIALIQRFTLLWGSPLYSAAGVISILLLGMGLGSIYSQRFAVTSARLVAITATIALLQAGMLWGTGRLFAQWVELPMSIAMAIPLLAGPAFLMGMPFPLGLRLLAAADPAQIPWAWAVNGCLSVLTSTAAGVVALAWGFQSLVLAAVFGYLSAALAVALSFGRR